MTTSLPKTWWMCCAMALACVGCDRVDSSTVPTSEMGILLDVELDEAGEGMAFAHLTTDNEALLEATYVDLAEGDALAIATGTQQRPMDERFLVGLGIYQYTAELDGLMGGEALRVSLQRAQQADALNTWVEVPPPLEVDLPASSFSRRDGLSLTWQGGDRADRVRVAVTSACVEAVQRDVAADVGGLFLGPDAFASPPSTDPAQPCALVVAVTAINDGTVDPAFGRGGAVHATRTLELALTALP